MKALSPKIKIVLFLLLTFNGLFAQQQAMYTQYMFNHVAINPAYAASKNAISAMLLARAQWVNLEGAPTSTTFTLHGPVKKERIGIGISILHDVIGPTSETDLTADFAFQFKINRDITLALGAKGSIGFYRAELAKLRIIDQNDPRFAEDIREDFLPNIGSGVFLYSKEFYLGLSIPKMIRNNININSDIAGSGNSYMERHFFLIGGYIFDLASDVKFKPSFLAKIIPDSRPAIDFNASFIIRDYLWLGATYRYDNSMSAMAEIRIGAGLFLGYAFDFTTSKLMRFNSGTHEILVSYDLGFDRFRVKSPRYF